MKTVGIDSMVGKTFDRIVGEPGDEIVAFFGESCYAMRHFQDCCENVELLDIVGDIGDLVGSPIVLAYAAENSDGLAPLDSYDESWTWTFYHLATVKGYVTFRWYGTSNGYYSESVDIYECAAEQLEELLQKA